MCKIDCSEMVAICDPRKNNSYATKIRPLAILVRIFMTTVSVVCNVDS